MTCSLSRDGDDPFASDSEVEFEADLSEQDDVMIDEKRLAPEFD